MEKQTLSKKQKKIMKQMINSKLQNNLVKKYILTATGTVVTPASITNSGTMYNLESVAQGSGNQARTGNNAIVKKIWYHGQLYPDSTDVNNQFRVVLFRWNDNTTAVAGDLFTSSNYSTSFYNIDNIATGKLQILFDRNFTVCTPGKGSEFVGFNIKCNYPIQWNSASAVPAIQGSLNLFIVSDSTAVPSPTIAGNVCVLLEQ
jgi:hypothetical protein